MNKEQIKKELKLRDRVTRVLLKDKNIRAVAVKNSKTAIEAQRRHNLNVVSASLLSRQLSAATLMAAFLKGEERIIIESEGNGPISYIYSEALHVGESRGYINQNKNIDARNFNSVGDALGIGLLKVSRILYNRSEPISGIIPIQNGDIATDLAYYLHQSEQIPSSVVLDTKFDKDGNISESGGLIVQAMPDADKDDLAIITDNILKLGKLSEKFSDEWLPEDILKEVIPFEFEIISNKQVDFFCRCSKKKFLKSMSTFPHQTIVEMEEADERELVCQYCNEKYYLDVNDFNELKTLTLAKSN